MTRLIDDNIGGGIAFLQSLDRAGFSAELAAKLRNPDNAKLAVELLNEQFLAPEPISGPNIADLEVYRTVVDYSQTFDQMVAVGDYGWESEHAVSANWPISGEGEVEHEMVLLHFNRTMTSDEVLTYMKQEGLKSAKVEDLLAFGAAHPETQREFPIVELGTVWLCFGGGRYVLCLSRGDRSRDLNVDWRVSDWHGYCRFLAIKS